MKILIDSREQAPLPFRVGGSISEVVVEGLPFADYWGETEWGEQMDVVFERKSLGDLWLTLANDENHKRFKREMERARKHGVTLILIIEGTYGEVEKGYRYSRFKGKSMIKLLFTMWVKYNLVTVFCDGRTEMKKYITSFFEARGRWMKQRRKNGG